MTEEELQRIRHFEARVRQLMMQYDELKTSNEALHTALHDKETEIRELNRKLTQLQTDYKDLKTARMLTVSDGDIDTAKRRMANLVREVNQCISMLSTLDAQDEECPANHPTPDNQ